MERNVKIRLDGGNTIEQTTSAVTYADLKAEIDLNFEDKKVIIRETRNTLESDAAILPEGDFTLFVYPTRVKSGHGYEQLGYHDLRALCIARNLSKKDYGCANYGTVEEMREKLVASDRGCTGCNIPQEELSESQDFELFREDLLNCLETIGDALNEMRNKISDFEFEEMYIEPQLDSLSAEYEEFRAELNRFGIA